MVTEIASVVNANAMRITWENFANIPKQNTVLRIMVS